MTTAPERISPGSLENRAGGSTTFPDDQLYMLKLTLELQIEALLLALGSSAVVSRETRTDPAAPAPAGSAAVTSAAVTPEGRPASRAGRLHASSPLSSAAAADQAGAERTGTGTSAADLPWEKWLAEDLELACSLTRDCVGDGIPLPSSMGIVTSRRPGFVVESLAARYSAMAAVVGEMLGRTDAGRHATAVARLQETRARCEERLDALLGETPQAAAERLFAPAEPGHYLG